MITLHIFTEEPSARTVFKQILPKLLPEGVAFHIYSHQGKQDLEKALKTTVPIISRLPGARILIIRDQDSGNCKDIKKQLQDLIKDKCKSPFLTRIACHELESWFLGDLKAIKRAYPRFKPENYQHQARFRQVDNIENPNAFLLSIIPEYQGRKWLPKLEVSEKISPCLDLSNNHSTSFNHTVTGIKKLIR
jgi:hypothetical protein